NPEKSQRNREYEDGFADCGGSGGRGGSLGTGQIHQCPGSSEKSAGCQGVSFGERCRKCPRGSHKQKNRGGKGPGWRPGGRAEGQNREGTDGGADHPL